MDIEICSGGKRLSEVEHPDAFKKWLKEKKRSQWMGKRLHGRFLKDIEKVNTERTWKWLKREHLKKKTDAMMCAAQEQALWGNSIKHHIGR